MKISQLTISKQDFKAQVLARISEGETLYAQEISDNSSVSDIQKQYSMWHDYNLEFLKQSFNVPDNEYFRSYESVGKMIGMRVTTIGGRPDPMERIQRFRYKFSLKIDNLKKLERKIELLKSEYSDVEEDHFETELDKSKIFIVHGHDELAKTEVARFIEKLGFEAIILHEKASSGKTIIEKIEEYSNVGFGVVLYTPCDIGSRMGDEKFNLVNRARQNVVFEHGYLIGKIGRNNVAALVKDEVETPNDISGVVYISLNSGEWKLQLAKELRNSGYFVDMNLVI